MYSDWEQLAQYIIDSIQGLTLKGVFHNFFPLKNAQIFVFSIFIGAWLANFPWNWFPWNNLGQPRFLIFDVIQKLPSP